jgi:hypothetical protein
VAGRGLGLTVNRLGPRPNGLEVGVRSGRTVVGWFGSGREGFGSGLVRFGSYVECRRTDLKEVRIKHEVDLNGPEVGPPGGSRGGLTGSGVGLVFKEVGTP